MPEGGHAIVETDVFNGLAIFGFRTVVPVKCTFPSKSQYCGESNGPGCAGVANARVPYLVTNRFIFGCSTVITTFPFLCPRSICLKACAICSKG